MTAFPLAIAFTLGADVIAEHGTEDKILFGRELAQWAGDDEPNGLQALASPEVEVQILLSYRLKYIGDALTLQTSGNLLTIFLVAGEQHHLAHTFSKFIDVVHQHHHLPGHGRCSHNRVIIFVSAKVWRKNEWRNT